MAKTLTAQQRILRFRSEGYTDTQIGKVINRSAKTVGRYARGETGGKAEKSIVGALREFAGYSGKRKGEVLKGERKLERALPPVRPSVINAAKADFAFLDKGGVEKVVINLKFGTGRARILGGRGGIQVDTIKKYRSLKAFINHQAALQGNNSSISDPEIDWSTVTEVSLQEF